jgi:hypothetical protein
MSPARTSARERARRKALRAEMARIAEIARETTRQLIEEGLVAGRISDDGEIVIDADAEPGPWRPPAPPRRGPPCR